MRKLSVLVIHNQYQQSAGEDAVVRAEVEMLRHNGHHVVTFIRSSSDIADFSLPRKASLLLSTTWNRRVYAELREVIRKERPDIAHCHNLVPLVSPAAYDACHAEGVPVVQTLHNYRLLCPAGTLFAKGQICEDCNRGLARAVARGCYRHSRLQTAALTLMLSAHRLRGTWSHRIDAYLALSQFSRDRFVANGLPGGKVHVKPNFLARDPGHRTGPGAYALFVGRLSPEKGVLRCLEHGDISHIFLWSLLATGRCATRYPPWFANRAAATSNCLDIWTPRTRKLRCKELVFWSSRAAGTNRSAWRFWKLRPVAFQPLQHGRAASQSSWPMVVPACSLIPKSQTEFAEKASWAWSHPAEMEAMGLAARRLYQEKFTAERNYESLMSIYGSLVPN